MKLRPARSYERALTRIVEHVGVGAAATIAGVAERTVQDWCDPDSPRSCPIHVAELLDRAWRDSGKRGRPMADTLRRRLKMADKGPVSIAISLVDRFATIIAESAQAKSALLVVTQPGASPLQRAIAAREVEDSIAAWEDVLPHLIPTRPQAMAMTRAPPN